MSAYNCPRCHSEYFHEIGKSLGASVYECLDCGYKYNDKRRHDAVYTPEHYTNRPTETVEAIEAVVEGLPPREAYLLGNVLKYVDRRDDKGDAAENLAKANNYAHRLVTGEWRRP